MNLKPLGEHVIIDRDSLEEKSKGGIVLPTENQRQKTTGTVLAVGNKVEELEVGDRVVFTEHSAKGIPSQPRNIRILMQGNVIAKEVSA